MKFFPVFLILFFLSCSTGGKQEVMQIPDDFDWQGHRGARGLMPENTVEGFLKALEFPEVTTLEMDVVVAADSQVVVSHEPWISGEICLDQKGAPLSEEAGKQLLIYQMDAPAAGSYDCGSKLHPRFPDQQKLKAFKPALAQVINAVERYCERNDRPKPHYNIELKSRPEWYDALTPPPPLFTRLVLETLHPLKILDRTIFQSFDPRILQEVKRQDPAVTTALLIENYDTPAENLKVLGFIPEIYSPDYKLLDAGIVKHLHEIGMRVIPWTVNEVKDMRELIQMGVDGIITDYPDRIGAVKE